MYLWTLALEVHQHTLFRHLKNKIFSRNLGQNIFKNAYFLEKGYKIAAANPLGWGLRPQPLRCYSHLLI